MDLTPHLLYELSLSPDIFEHADQNPDEVAYPLLILLQDVRKRGFISDLNAGDWKREAARAVRSARGGDYCEKIYQLFSVLEDESRIVHHPDPASISQQRDWVEHASNLTDSWGRSPTAVVTDPNLAKQFKDAWAVKPLIASPQWHEMRPESVEMSKSLDDYQIELQNLIGPSRRVRLVDPYFSCRTKNIEFIRTCSMLVSNWLETESAEIHVHTSITNQKDEIKVKEIGGKEAKEKMNKIRDEWKERLSKIRKRLDKKWINFHLWMWREESGKTEYHDMHDRYIFTEHNAVSTPWGLDCPNKTPTPRSRWSLLSKEAREELQSEFPRTEVNYHNRKEQRKRNNDHSNAAFYELVRHFSI